MKRTVQIYLTGMVISLLVVWLTGCQKEEKPGIQDLILSVSPKEPQTTDEVAISMFHPDGQVLDDRVYFRWDWTGDSIWDTPFSIDSVGFHRYFHPDRYGFQVQMIDGEGNSRIIKDTVVVDRGFSAPKAAFTISPEVGNPNTEFIFDASGTYDDEDSLDQLLFRWNFFGEGYVLTEFSSHPVIKRKFPQLGVYAPILEVKDPSGKTGKATHSFTVNLVDPRIHADFTWLPDDCTDQDTVLFDASATYYEDDPVASLLYSWQLGGSFEWTTPTEEPTIQYVFPRASYYTTELKVIKKPENLFRVVRKEFYVSAGNRPPTAVITESIPIGNIQTVFYFDAWRSIDDVTPPSEMLIRWDFEGDGIWDTPFTKEPEILHQYGVAGDYRVRLQVKDEGGLTDTTGLDIKVTPFRNPTGYIRDFRDGELYGTVQINGKWWMAENLRYTTPKKSDKGLAIWVCLYEDPEWCEKVGKLYRIDAVMVDRSDSIHYEYHQVCPDGWRVPTQSDYQSLIEGLGGEDQAYRLLYGESSDFNALNLGYATYSVIFDANMMPSDTVYRFKETYQSVWLFSTSQPYDPTNLRIDTWMMSIDAATREAWYGYRGLYYYMPVRCVKE